MYIKKIIGQKNETKIQKIKIVTVSYPSKIDICYFGFIIVLNWK